MSQHSSYSDTSDWPNIGGLPLVPWEDTEIVEEVFAFYRTNILFKTYALESEADKLIVFMMVILTQALRQLATLGQAGVDIAEQKLQSLASDRVQLGNKNYLMNIVSEVEEQEDKEELQLYFKGLKDQVIQEVLQRFFDSQGNASPDLRFWVGLAKSHSFLGLDYAS